MHRLGNLFSRIAQRLLPDPMVIACGLTLLVVLSAWVVPQSIELVKMPMAGRVPAVARMWLDGVWEPKFLVFALQMCVVLLTGYGLAKAPPAMAFLRHVAGRVRSNRSAVLCVTAVSCVGCWINWGFGLIAAGILAGELRRSLREKGVACRYALLVAGAYAGMMIWHGGLSGSAPLKMAENGLTIIKSTSEGHVAVDLDPISIGDTVFSTGNLILSGFFILAIPLLLRSMASSTEDDLDDAEPEAPAAKRSPAPIPTGEPSIADRANRSRGIPILLGLVGIIALGNLVGERSARAIDINFVNTVFLILGLLLHRNLGEYVAAIAEGGRAVSGIVLQFPLYSGIQGVMFKSGLAVAMSQAFVDMSTWFADAMSVSSETTFPVAAFLSAGVVNLFVPSGGGQWIVQGPIMCAAADALSLPIEQTVMAVSYGDQWTNMIQPFWAIPLMGLTGVNVRRFMGYCALLMILALPIFAAALVFLY